jgi:hypothetical protein
VSEEQNVLEQLRNRQRASVPSRTDPLIPETRVEDSDEQSLSSPSTLEDLQQKLAQYPKTKRRSAIVIEEDIENQITQYCRSHKITIETFLEAAWAISQSNQTTLKKITKEAQSRYNSRKEAGKLRRLITMLSQE